MEKNPHSQRFPYYLSMTEFNVRVAFLDSEPSIDVRDRVSLRPCTGGTPMNVHSKQAFQSDCPNIANDTRCKFRAPLHPVSWLGQLTEVVGACHSSVVRVGTVLHEPHSRPDLPRLAWLARWPTVSINGWMAHLAGAWAPRT